MHMDSKLSQLGLPYVLESDDLSTEHTTILAKKKSLESGNDATLATTVKHADYSNVASMY